MAKKIFMTSLKGGTGVTACAVYLAFALAEAGERTLVADGDAVCSCAVGTGGCAALQVYTLADYERGACRAKQTAIPHPKAVNLSFMSSQGLRDGGAADRAIGEVDGLFDYIVLDKIARRTCDAALIVTDPFPLSVKSAEHCRAMLSDAGVKEIGLIVNKLNGGQILNGETMSAQEIAATLRLPLKAVIPEDLALPTGRMKRETQKAFQIAAACVTGRRDEICNVMRGYLGFNGWMKRKARERI